MIESGIKIHL